MTKRIVPAAFAFALLATLPLDTALARGGGGGGDRGSGGGGSHASDRGSLGYSRPQDPSSQKLFDDARRECNGPQFSSGATPRIDYDANSFTCVEPGSTRR